MPGFFWAFVYALQAKDAFVSMFSLSGVVYHIYIHGANFLTLIAHGTFFHIVFHANKSETAWRFQKDCDGAKIFAKCPVVFERICQRDPANIVRCVPGDETPKHNAFYVGYVQ